MQEFVLEDGESFALLRAQGFAHGYVHAFVVRGHARARLFKPDPVPRTAILRALGIGAGELHLARQIHGSGVWEVPEDRDVPGRLPRLPEHPPSADALVSRVPHHAVGIATADCLPILLAGANGACASVHAGWRGLLAGVIEAAVRAVRAMDPYSAEATRTWSSSARGGAASVLRPTAPAENPVDASVSSPPVMIDAAIGPAIGVCCFEVGSEVADQFSARFPSTSDLVLTSSKAGKSFVALELAARQVLEGAGIDPRSIRASGLCTLCGGDRLESYRRDGAQAGRMLAVIARS